MKLNLKSLITREYLAVSEDDTVGSAVDFLRKQKADFQRQFAYIYVVNQKGILTGVLQTRDLVLADPLRNIHSLMRETVASLSEDASTQEAIELFNLNAYLAVPVVDSARRLVGILSRSNLETNLSSDERRRLRRMDPNETEEVEGSGVFQIALKRLPWLLISVTSGLVCSYILGIFIGKIESIVALILFIPIILGLAGNVGTQLARVTSRGLEEGKLSLNKIIFVLGKEILVGLIIGFCAFALAASIALLWKRYPYEGIALGLSIVGVSLASGLMGIILPVTFKTLRIKANLASGLFLLLICDIVSLLLYFLISLSLVSPTLVIS